MVHFGKARCLIVLAGLLLAPQAPSNVWAQQASSQDPSYKPRSAVTVAPKCETSGESELTIRCSYLRQKNSGSSLSPIALIRASFSFKTNDESHMRVELAFVNESAAPFTDARSVYLEIDDSHGQNHVRRVLPRVDLTKIRSGQPVTFSEILLTPAFSPGDYVIHLWIPSKDPARQFDSSQNLLLRGTSVANLQSRLNTLATFTVASGGGN